MKQLLIAIGLLFPLSAHAQVVFTEIRWAGSEVSSADEWFVIQNISNQPVNLGGWDVLSRKSSGADEPILTLESIILAAGNSLLISNYDQDRSALTKKPDMVTTAVSLPNTKLFLQLRNTAGELVDQVDDGTGQPFAGSKDPHRSMMRINKNTSGTVKENWLTEGETSVSSQSSSSSQSSTTSSSLQSSLSLPSSSASSVAVLEIQSGVVQTETKKIAQPDQLHVVGIVPLPTTGRRQDQQVYITYTGGSAVTLNGWQLDNRNGGSPPVPLDGITFDAGQTKVFATSWLGISFTPVSDTVQLIAPDGTVVSRISWENADLGQVVRPITASKKRMPVTVLRSSSSTLRVALTKESFIGIAPSIERYWSRSAHKYLHPFITVDLVGVHAVDKSKILVEAGETLWLETVFTSWHPQPTVAAYAYEVDGTLLQHRLLTEGLVRADREVGHPRRADFIAMQTVEELPIFESGSTIDLVENTIVNTEKDSEIEQKMYTIKPAEVSSQNQTYSLPVRYKNIVSATVEDPRKIAAEPPLDSRVVSLLEANTINSKADEKPANTGLPWLLLFSQSALWLVFSGKKLL